MKLTKQYQLISRDEFDTCANYARLKGDRVEIETLYRYGKPAHRIISLEEFETLKASGLV
jgi:hypothetical protein